MQSGSAGLLPGCEKLPIFSGGSTGSVALALPLLRVKEEKSRGTGQVPGELKVDTCEDGFCSPGSR